MGSEMLSIQVILGLKVFYVVLQSLTAVFVVVDDSDLVQEPLEEDRESPQENYNVPLVGKKVYVKYGGSERGFWAEVIAENDRKIALRVTTDDGLYTKVGDLRVEHRSFGNTMFFSEEAARGLGASRDAKYQRELARYREKQSLRGSGKDGG